MTSHDSHRRLSANMMDRWKTVAGYIGIESASYELAPKGAVEAKTFESNTDFSWGLMLNSYRFKRPKQTDDCPLCEVVTSARSDSNLLLLPWDTDPDYIFIPNKYPVVAGASLAVHKGTRREEQAMFGKTPLDTARISSDLTRLTTIANAHGFDLSHNCEGAGATIFGHEHYQLVDFSPLYDAAGKRFGIDSSTCSPIPQRSDVWTMNGYEFAHLVFDERDPERIARFLTAINGTPGSEYTKGFVPHTLSQRKEGGMVFVPSRPGGEGRIGAGERSGIRVYRDASTFESATLETNLDELGRELYLKGEIDLVQYLD